MKSGNLVNSISCGSGILINNLAFWLKTKHSAILKWFPHVLYPFANFNYNIMQKN